ncbi:MAG: ABC transporter permease [Deltaproteobacteria bacterium]|nr:ABC transporter permease [Deltaproteobacteria bacterium]
MNARVTNGKPIVDNFDEIHGTSLWADAWRRLRKHKLAVAGGAFLGFVVVFCFLGPMVVGWVWGYTYESQNLAYGAQPPSFAHWFGTDFLGRDLMVRVMHGGRISLMVGVVATIVSLFIGVTYGAISGFAGGVTDNIMMRVVDVLYTLPYMFIVILLVVIFGRSIFMVFVGIGGVLWLTMARLVRGQVLSLKHRDYVEAARAIGVPNLTIIFRHLVPNAMGPIIVLSTLTIPSVMLQEAFLSFLGLGVQPPASSWGLLVAEGAQSMVFYPWLLVFPAAFLALTLLSLNFLGDGLRDALDPKTRKD